MLNKTNSLNSKQQKIWNVWEDLLIFDFVTVKTNKIKGDEPTFHEIKAIPKFN